MKRKIVLSLCAFFVLLLATTLWLNLKWKHGDLTQEEILEMRSGKGYVPENGYVPDEVTAVRIAAAVWAPIYGKSILLQHPFKVMLVENKIWIVEGSILPFVHGGVAYIAIDKETGEIYKVIHTK